MTARVYDYIIEVEDASGFTAGNNFVGVTTGTIGLIANVDIATNNIKVKIDNVMQKYNNGESVFTTSITTTGGTSIETIAFDAPSWATSDVSHNSVIKGIIRSPYIAEKNAFTQKPLVRLYTIYYPGEWYPPNANGNPVLAGSGHSWPIGFPFRFAEIRGDIISDIGYTALHAGEEYIPFPIDSGGISMDSSGKINEITLTVSNFDNIISALIDDPFLVGNNIANATIATVNKELVSNIDPRTVPGDIDFDQAIVDSRGGINLAFDFSSTEVVDGTWQKGKIDTRDLLGAAIEIKSTFANFLDVWPEYSRVTSLFSNAVSVVTSLPYRIGDNVKSNNDTVVFSIERIDGDTITFNKDITGTLTTGDRLYIINEEADSESFAKDVFKIDALETLNDQVGVFKLTTWLQFFKLQLPKRRYLKDTCSWIYKGDECQYPDDGSGTIPGGSKTANGFFDIKNGTVVTVANDVCAHNFAACALRKNTIHFGGFKGTGRVIPR